MVGALLGLCLFVATADDKKPGKITAENIEIGRVGTIDRLVVEKHLGEDSNLIIANFGAVRVMLEGYPSKGIGKGKVLPADLVWRVDSVLKSDGSGNGLSGCYVLQPERKKEKK
jgi:hypothetical protein